MLLPFAAFKGPDARNWPYMPAPVLKRSEGAAHLSKRAARGGASPCPPLASRAGGEFPRRHRNDACTDGCPSCECKSCAAEKLTMGGREIGGPWNLRAKLSPLSQGAVSCAQVEARRGDERPPVLSGFDPGARFRRLERVDASGSDDRGRALAAASLLGGSKRRRPTESTETPERPKREPRAQARGPLRPLKLTRIGRAGPRATSPLILSRFEKTKRRSGRRFEPWKEPMTSVHDMCIRTRERRG